MKTEKIFIVAGHGKSGNFFKKNDPGAIAKDGTTERELNLQITRSIFGENVVYIGVDEDLTLAEKIKKINSFGLDCTNSLLVSIHCNSAGSLAKGAEAFYYHNSGESKKLAENILKEICQKTGLKNRGAKSERLSRYGKLGIVHDTAPLAVLIECGFLSNVSDLDVLKNKSDLIGNAVKAGIENFLDKNLDNDLQNALKNLSLVWNFAEKLKNNQQKIVNSIGKRIQSLVHKTADILREKFK